MGLKEKLIQKLWQLLLELISKYSNFIKLPSLLDALMAATLLLIKPIIDWLKNLLQKFISQFLSQGNDPLLAKYFSDPAIFNNDSEFNDAVNSYTKEDPTCRAALNAMNNDWNDEAAGEITNSCADPDAYYEQLESGIFAKANIPSNNASADDFINGVANLETEQEFIDKLDKFEAGRKAQFADLFNKAKNILPWLFLLYIILTSIVDWFTQNQYPSKYRGKFFDKKLRWLGVLIKNTPIDKSSPLYQQNSQITNTALGFIKTITDVVGAVLLGHLIYELNRKYLSEESRAQFGTSASNILCNKDNNGNNTNTDSLGNVLPSNIPFPTPSFENTAPDLIDPSTNVVTLPQDLTNFSCPLPDNYIVAHKPFNKAQEEFTCPLPEDSFDNQQTLNDLQNIIDSGQLGPLNDLSTKAIYSYIGSNSSPSSFVPLVKTGDKVTTSTPIFRKGKEVIISSVAGIVEIVDTSKKEIIIKEIKSADDSPIQEKVTKLGDTFRALSDVKIFLKDWYIPTLFPQMLKVSPGRLTASTVYPLGGVTGRWQKAKKDFEKIKETYEERVEVIGGKDNVESKLNDGKTPEGLSLIKEEIESEENKFYKNLKTLGKKYVEQAKKTSPRNILRPRAEYNLTSYYKTLYNELLSYKENQMDEETRNNGTQQQKDAATNIYVQEVIDEMDSWVKIRKIIDFSDIQEIQGNIQDMCKELDPNGDGLDNGIELYHTQMDLLFKEEMEASDKTISNIVGNLGSLTGTTRDNKIKNRIIQNFPDYTNSLLTWVSELGKNNENLESDEKTDLRADIFTQWQNSIIFIYQAFEEFEVRIDPIEQTRTEANFIINYMSNLWKKLPELTKKSQEIIDELDEISQQYTPFTIVERDQIQYRFYGFGDKRFCPLPTVPDERLSPFSEAEFKDMKYWLKYCSFATLASVISGPANWGTGLPPPIGPIPLPTIFIPIKPFQLEWGTLLIGLTVTGIYPFPFIMVGNLSTGYHVPFFDPVTIIQNQVDKLKEKLIGVIKKYRLDTLTGILALSVAAVREIRSIVDELIDEAVVLRSKLPKRDRAAEAGLIEGKSKEEATEEYKEEKKKHEEEKATLEEKKLENQERAYEAEVKVEKIQSAQAGNDLEPVDPQTEALKKTEDGIKKSFDKLDALIASMDVLLAGLPVATAPGSANFLLTAKNPKPVTKMDDGLNDSINEPILNKVIQPFELDKEDLAQTGYRSKVNKSFVNGKAYMNTLAASSVALIPKEAFPKYEMLKVTNLAWTLKFLLPSWAPTGKKMYGFPGFP
jgi:hypothetical protein